MPLEFTLIIGELTSAIAEREKNLLGQLEISMTLRCGHRLQIILNVSSVKFWQRASDFREVMGDDYPT